MTGPIALLTDSSCDIPQALLEQYDIGIVPLGVIWGDETLRDRVELSPEEFYRRLKTDPRHPTSSQPTPADMQKVYRQAIDGGAKEIVMLSLSSGMSGTFRLAEQIGRQMEVPVHVVDAKGPTMSLGWQVLAAARIRELGGNALEMVAAAAKARARMVQVVCLDTLDFLFKGGRIGGAKHFIGSLLNLKPIVEVNHQTGTVESVAQARTRKKSIETFLGRFFELLGTGRKKHVALLHGDAEPEARELAERIRQEHAPDELLVNLTGPVMGIHTGPGALSLCGYTEEE
ncbi:MAG TPA: DegV family protein [Anaerolineales bacterium]|nr:DegV family protein [Anaerolineales bacterium]